MENKKKNMSMISQIALLFLIGSILVGLLTYYSLRNSSRRFITAEIEMMASNVSNEVKEVIMEYPAFPWLIRYWYENADTLDIPYDEHLRSGTKTEEKVLLFESRHPNLSLRYLSQYQAQILPAEDQKLYAEIAYSWLITRINQIKQTNMVDFLFCVATEPPFDTQFFLFSGADLGAERGTEYEQVYPLGVISTVGEDQQAGMKSASEGKEYLAHAGGYMDYYSYFTKIGDKTILIGLTYNLTFLDEMIAENTRSRTFLALGLQAILSLISLAAMSYFIVRPLKLVQNNIRFYKETKDSGTTRANLEKIHSQNEIGILSNDVKELTTEIDNYIDQIETITIEKQRIDTELNLASRIQSGSLPTEFPPFPNRKEFEIYANMNPAKEVGGDFYNFFFIDDDHLAFMIADVSGKGIPGSLFMMTSMMQLRNASRNSFSPANVLARVNHQICTNNPEEMFVSVWMAIIDLSTGKVTAANAGHEYPFIKQPNQPYQILKDKHGFVLGGMDDMKYQDYELQLEPGSKIFVYTDGLPEATTKDGSMFGVEHIEEVLNQNQDANVEETLNKMNEAVDNFVSDAEQFDDLTMLCFTYLGKQDK